MNGGGVIEPGVRLASGLPKTVRGEIPVVVGERHPEAKGEGSCAGASSVPLRLRKKARRYSMPAELRVNREAAEIEALTLPRCEYATHQPAGGLRDKDHVIRERRGNRLGGLAERPGLGLKAAAIFLEGRTDKLGHRGALRSGREPDRDVS